MKNSVIWSFLSVVALGTSGLVAGCDSDEKLARSALGESCDNTASCEDGLKCVDGTCVQKSSSNTGGSGNTGEGGEPGTSGSLNTGGTTTVKPPVLGGVGESCTKRADCEDGLGCFNQRCQEDSGGVGGEGNGPTLGGIGETCGLTTDCQSGLACLPADYQPIDLKALGSNSVGVCTPTDNGLEPSGNACGAECTTAADCCELPTALHESLGANSCTQISELLSGVDCAKVTAGSASAALCFASTTYCECAKNTWACTEQGRCAYTAACKVSGSNPTGCPSLTRTGTSLDSTCDTASKKCGVVTGCESDADCDENVPVADAGDTCANGKCACDTDSGSCYRKCGEDIDCPVGYACDTDASLCRKAAQCETDAFCVTWSNDINSKCVEGMCQASCRNDLDCNYGSLTNGSDTQVCNADGFCEPVGCTSDDQCPTAGGVRTFCAKAPAPTAVNGVVSAVTD